MHKEYIDQDGVVHERKYEGEKLDVTPVAIPLRFTRASNLNEVVRQMVRSEELRRLAEQAGAESFDEADDFSVDDDDDPRSPYEEVFEGDVLKDNFEQLAKVIKKAAEKEKPTAAGDGDQPATPGAVDKP